MVTIPESVAQAIPKLFDIHKCWLIVNLAAELNYAVISVRRFLAEFGYYSSYTHNGKYYTLRSIPQFHHDGIWLYQDIGFSRRRSLTETLIHLASRSPAGLTAEELIEKLHCRCHTVLAALHRSQRLDRDKVGRRYVYLSVAPRVNEQQRAILAPHAVPLTPLPAEIAVLVLAAYIRDPEASTVQLAQRLRRQRNIRIDPQQIDRLFTEHGVKKTPLVPGAGRFRH